MSHVSKLEQEEEQKINQLVKKAKELRDELSFLQGILNKKNEAFIKLYKGRYVVQKKQGVIVLEQYPTKLGYLELETYGLEYDPERNHPLKSAMYDPDDVRCVICGWDNIAATGSNGFLHYAYCPRHSDFIFLAQSIYRKEKSK